MSTAQVRAFSFPRPDHRAVLLGMRVPQVVILGAAVVLGVATVMAVPSALGLLIGLVFLAVGAVGAVVPVRGRSLDQWLPVVLRWGAAGARHQRRWVSPVPLLGNTRGKSDKAAPPPPLAGVTLLRVSRLGGRDVAVSKDPRGGTFSAVAACR